MSIPFPMRPTGPWSGHPHRASHCVCIEGPMVPRGHDTCTRCGKHAKQTVADTWERRARHLAEQRAKRKAKA